MVIAMTRPLPMLMRGLTKRQAAEYAEGWALWEVGEGDKGLSSWQRQGWRDARRYYELARVIEIVEYAQRGRRRRK